MPLDVFHKSFAQDATGLLILADGVSAPRRWDGLSSSTDTAGVIAPTTALTVGGSGKGPLIGEYTAYSRFVDARTNLSNLSPISSPWRPFTCGAVATATNSIPIAVGSIAHGLTTGDKVRVAGVQGNTAANGGWTITVTDANNFALNGSAGSGAPTANTGTWVGGLTTPPARGVVTSASNATPIVVGAVGHGLVTGDKVTIKGALVNTAANGNWTITRIDANNFSLDTSAGNGAHTANSGYYVSTRVTPSSGTVLSASNASPVAIGSVAHGLVTGDTVTVAGVEGNTGANGTFAVVVVDANNFTLTTSVGSGAYAAGGTWVGGSGPPVFAGQVTDASNAEPIVITSADHGLTTGDYVSLTNVEGNTAANGTWPVVRVDADTFSLSGSTGNGAWTARGTWAAGARAVLYTSVPLSGESKVTHRQVLRNLDGEADTYYVDVDTTDLADTSLESTADDTDLATGTAVPLLTDAGALSANLYDVPPNHKAVVAVHTGRAYYAVDAVVRQGHAQVTSASTTVTGVGTAWKTSFANRSFTVVGETAGYTISSVNESAQTLTLTGAYAGSTDKFAVYAIRPAPSERRLIYYSEASLPEAVPAINQIELADTNDEIVGLMQAGSYLYFLERHHLWRYSVQSDPAADGFAWLAARRGCLNNRCWVVVGQLAYLLDSDGIYTLAGGQEVDPIGNMIQDIFRPSQAEFQINLAASDYAHASHYPNQETIRWFVPFSGQDLPRHAIVLNYRQKRWWIEEYPRPIASSAAAVLNGRRVVYVGSDAKKTLALWQGTTDGPDPAAGTVSGTATSATLLSLTDTAATFPSSGVVNNPVTITAGTGRGQTRRVTAVSGTTLSVRDPWLELPDTTSAYQLGGVSWRYQSGDYRYVESEQNSPTRLEIVFQAQDEAASLTMEVYHDFSATPLNMAVTKSFAAGDGVKTTAGQPQIDVDLSQANGFAWQRLDRHRDPYAGGPHYVSIGLSGVGGAELTRVYQLAIDGASS